MSGWVSESVSEEKGDAKHLKKTWSSLEEQSLYLIELCMNIKIFLNKWPFPPLHNFNLFLAVLPTCQRSGPTMREE